jgi:hypothetical protein
MNASSRPWAQAGEMRLEYPLVSGERPLTSGEQAKAQLKIISHYADEVLKASKDSCLGER